MYLTITKIWKMTQNKPIMMFLINLNIMIKNYNDNLSVSISLFPSMWYYLFIVLYSYLLLVLVIYLCMATYETISIIDFVKVRGKLSIINIRNPQNIIGINCIKYGWMSLVMYQNFIKMGWRLESNSCWEYCYLIVGDSVGHKFVGLVLVLVICYG